MKKRTIVRSKGLNKKQLKQVRRIAEKNSSQMQTWMLGDTGHGLTGGSVYALPLADIPSDYRDANDCILAYRLKVNMHLNVDGTSPADLYSTDFTSTQYRLRYAIGYSLDHNTVNQIWQGNPSTESTSTMKSTPNYTEYTILKQGYIFFTGQSLANGLPQKTFNIKFSKKNIPYLKLEYQKSSPNNTPSNDDQPVRHRLWLFLLTNEDFVTSTVYSELNYRTRNS